MYSIHLQKFTMSSCYEGRPLFGPSNHLFIFVIVYIGRLCPGFKTNHLPQSSKNSCRLQKSNVQQPNSYFIGDVINKLTYLGFFFLEFHFSILIQNSLTHTKFILQSISSWQFLLLMYQAMRVGFPQRFRPPQILPLSSDACSVSS